MSTVKAHQRPHATNYSAKRRRASTRLLPHRSPAPHQYLRPALLSRGSALINYAQKRRISSAAPTTSRYSSFKLFSYTIGMFPDVKHPRWDVMEFAKLNALIEMILPLGENSKHHAKLTEQGKVLLGSLAILIEKLRSYGYTFHHPLKLFHLRVDECGFFVMANHVLLESVTAPGISRSYFSAATIIEDICHKFGGYCDHELNHYICSMKNTEIHPYFVLAHPSLLPLHARGPALMDAYDLVMNTLPCRQKEIVLSGFQCYHVSWANIIKNPILSKWFATEKCKDFDPKKPGNFFTNLWNIESHSLVYQKELGEYTKNQLRFLIACKVPNVITASYVNLAKIGRLSKIEAESYFCLPGMACCSPGFCLRKSIRILLSREEGMRKSRRSSPSFRAPAYQSFRPVTRSMTRASSPTYKGGSAKTISRRISSDAFSIQLAASRPTVTYLPTLLKVTSSGWKLVALIEERKCARLTIDPTAKHSKVASSRAVKGKKYIDEEKMSLGDQLDGAVMQSPTKKLLTRKGPSDAPSKTKSTIKILGGKGAALPPTGKFQIEIVKNLASLPAKSISATTNDISQSVDAAVPLFAQQLPPEAANNSSVIKQAVTNETSQVNRLAATVATLPRQNIQTDYDKKLSNVPIMTNQASGLAGSTVPLVTPELEIGKVNDTFNCSSATYSRALLIKQQEQLLQQYKLASSQQKQQQLYIKGPALFENDDAPLVEPLGTRCQFCKLDVAFRPQGDAGRDANARPVKPVLACQHAFHSSCIESVYGLAEPAKCLACLEPGQRIDH